ncbi:MAG: ribbon-helix-helix protein, CopG family [Xanthomonadales bacterium]|nr:ribbon-helix-helix protein, CopG family [Xanthomonadales bacterium]
MGRMTIRATYALDSETDHRIRSLAKQWDVSQAEVIRRSVRAAVEQNSQVLSPRDVVQRYAKGPLPRSRTRTREVVRALRSWRHEDDKRRASPRAR